MKKKNRFSITTFTNPSHEQVYRVQGRMPNGDRIRQNFATEHEAIAWKAKLEVRALNLASTIGLKMTRLSDAELAEAEAAFQKLQGKSLGAAVNFFLTSFTEPVSEKSVKAAYDEFLTAKTAQSRRPATLSDLKCRIGLLVEHFGEKQVSQITSDLVHSLVFQPGIKAQTQKHRLTKIGQFFRWCIRRRYCLTNPVTLIDAPAVDDTEPKIYDLSEVRALLRSAVEYKNGKLVPYFALALFGGLRPAEIHRLTWSVIKIEERIIRIVGGMAKRRKRRVVQISENLVEWLLPYLGQTITGKNWQKDFNAVRRIAGFKGSMHKKGDEARKVWIPDGLRHSSLSAHLALHKHEGQTAQWAGNSPDILHSRYKGLMTDAEAEAFWKLSPSNINTEIVVLERTTHQPVAA